MDNKNSKLYKILLTIFLSNTGIDPPLVTLNPNELINKLNSISIAGGDDCPEMAFSGLKAGLEVALANSIVFLFTDATAKDPHLYNDIANLAQKKQIPINFLLTGDCSERSSERFLVYNKASRISGGQIYEMSKTNVKEVLLAIKDNMNPNYVVLRSVDVPAGPTTINFDVDMSLSELKISIVGKNPKSSIYDSSKTLVSASHELLLGSIKLSTIKNPKQGTWRIEANADEAYTVIISGLSKLDFNFGFSLKTPDSKTKTGMKPLIENKNILSMFISDTTQVSMLTSITVSTVPQSTSESSTEYSVNLTKQKDNMYSTDPFEIPNKTFKIKIKGQDTNGNTIERILPSSIVATYGGKI